MRLYLMFRSDEGRWQQRGLIRNRRTKDKYPTGMTIDMDSFPNFIVQHPHASDEELLFGAQSGDQRAFGELCRRYNGMLRRKIFRIVRHQEDAEDVLQQTFLSGYQNLYSFRGECKVSTWMTRIGINMSLMLLRKRKTLLGRSSDMVDGDGREFETAEFADPGLNPEQQLIAAQSRLVLHHAIQKLPSRFSELIEMYWGRERPLKEAAKVLGITEAAAKARMMRARRLLRRSLGEAPTFSPDRTSRSAQNLLITEMKKLPVIGSQAQRRLMNPEEMKNEHSDRGTFHALDDRECA